MKLFRTTVLTCAIALSASAALAEPDAQQIAGYIHPYVASNNFSGAVLVMHGGKAVFAKAYGYADAARRVRNTLHTRFHIASMSMQFTSAAAMRLVEQGALSLDAPVASIVEGIPNGDKITVRNLLAENSGLPDLNEQPGYAAMLQQHQTAATLVDGIRGLPPAAQPGGTSKREEHSAFNLLALIIEKKTGVPFAEALQRLVFRPLHMRESGADDDSPVRGAAQGLEPHGVYGVKAADAIRWSAKTGNASIYTTVGDEMLWLKAFFADTFLSAASRRVMLDYPDGGAGAGFGWFRNLSKRYGEPIAYMNGRAPGFASAMSCLPGEGLCVVVLSNVYASVPTTIGIDLMALEMGKPVDAFAPSPGRPDLTAFAPAPLRFQFGADFFQHNAVLAARADKGELFLDWPDGSHSPLIPLGRDHFLDRAYWEDVTFQRGADGAITGLHYDRFDGAALSR